MQNADLHGGENPAKSIARLSAIVNAAVDGIITIDARGCIEAVNPAARAMFGYSRDELIGHDVSVLMPSPDREQHGRYIQSYLSGGPRRIIGVGREVIGRRKDGSEFPLHLSVGEARIGGERLFTGILRDLTSVKKLEREFLQAQKMEAVGRLTSGIAHDFNNLLMGIIGCSDMALEHLKQGPSLEAREHVETLREAARRGSAIVAKLLAFSRKSPDESIVLDLNTLVDDTQRMLTGLLGADVELRVTTAPTPAWVRAHSGQLEQVLMNLIVNARHAMPNGGQLHLTVTVEDDVITLAVRDTGCGMSREVQAKVFEPFFTTRGEAEGTGLGLSTAYAIIHGCGGTIELESELGVGTRFIIRLPLAPTPPSVPAGAEPRAVEHPRSNTILVVEDDDLVRMTIRHYLSKNGFKVIEARSGADAGRHLERASEPSPALLLTDMVLPDTSGDALAREIQSRCPEINIVYMSAHDRQYLIENGRIAADALTLEKPFSEPQLLATIEDALS
ncbi:MAG: PAS domain S-box protein [Myxococcales bacterium]|nr:PAS domain S-box protein [Myxococcales bacterium]